MTLFPKGDWSIPGTWVPHTRDDQSKGAILICPKCAKGAVTAMKIATGDAYHGILEAKHECPQTDCGWADEVKLMWWSYAG